MQLIRQRLRCKTQQTFLMLTRGYIHHTGFQTEYIECRCSCLRASAFRDARGCFWAGEIRWACQRHFSGNIGIAAVADVEQKKTKCDEHGRFGVAAKQFDMRVAEVGAMKHLTP